MAKTSPRPVSNLPKLAYNNAIRKALEIAKNSHTALEIEMKLYKLIKVKK